MSEAPDRIWGEQWEIATDPVGNPTGRIDGYVSDWQWTPDATEYIKASIALPDEALLEAGKRAVEATPWSRMDDIRQGNECRLILRNILQHFNAIKATDKES